MGTREVFRLEMTDFAPRSRKPGNGVVRRRTGVRRLPVSAQEGAEIGQKEHFRMETRLVRIGL
jgi:hypothetical protein